MSIIEDIRIHFGLKKIRKNRLKQKRLKQEILGKIDSLNAKIKMIEEQLEILNEEIRELEEKHTYFKNGPMTNGDNGIILLTADKLQYLEDKKIANALEKQVANYKNEIKLLNEKLEKLDTTNTKTKQTTEEKCM